MTSLSGIFSTNLIKDHTPQIADWLIPAFVDDINEANEQARVANEQARVAKEEARVAKEEAKKLQTKIQNLKIILDFYKEIEMFLKDEKIHELEVYINKLKDDVQKIKLFYVYAILRFSLKNNHKEQKQLRVSMPGTSDRDSV